VELCVPSRSVCSDIRISTACIDLVLLLLLQVFHGLVTLPAGRSRVACATDFLME